MNVEQYDEEIMNVEGLSVIPIRPNSVSPILNVAGDSLNSESESEDGSILTTDVM